jgi:hypothetical protein
MAHALIHPAHQHGHRRARGQRKIAEDRKPEPEGNGHTGEDTEAGDTDKEDHQIEIAERLQPWRREPEKRNQQRDGDPRTQQQPDIADPRQPQAGKQRHQANAGRQRGGAP